MNNAIRITAIVGSYRKSGVVDTAVDALLASAAENGAAVTKIYLIDKHIEFCRNCRTCTQLAGRTRGECPITDEMSAVLDEIERADALVLASPMNFGSVTAVTKRFIERLACLAYWPWGAPGPKMRNPLKEKRAVAVASSAAPALLARLCTGMVGQLKKTAGILGAKTTDVLFIGLAAQQPKQAPGRRALKKARLLGRQLAVHQRVQAP